MNKYKLKNGATVEGTVDQILAIAKIVGENVDLTKLEGSIPKGYYLSEHMGMLKISEMNDRHLRNAILKHTRKYYENKNFEKLDNEQFAERLLGDEDEKLNSLIVEIVNRANL